jgi:hypothetical protein
VLKFLIFLVKFDLFPQNAICHPSKNALSALWCVQGIGRGFASGRRVGGFYLWFLLLYLSKSSGKSENLFFKRKDCGLYAICNVKICNFVTC